MKNIFLLTIYYLICVTSFAQTSPQFYNTFSGAASNNYPLNSSSGNKAQWIFAPNSFNASGTGVGSAAYAGYITKIFVKLGNAVSATNAYTNFSISISQGVGTNTNFGTTAGAAYNFVTGMTTVFNQASGFTLSGATANQWYGFNLNGSYPYNPNLSLVVEIKASNGLGNRLALTSGGAVRRLYGGYSSVVGTTATDQLNFGFNMIPSCNTITAVTACDTYTWNGTTYTTSGTYTYTSLNNAGCVNTATLNLTVNYSSTNGNGSATSCNTYTWNGSTYTTSGTYTYTSLNNAGCVNTATLNLAVNYSNTGNSSATACNTYTWIGTTYTTSGSYVKTFTNASGCDSVHTFNLTVNYSNTASSAATACNTYTWTGTTYTTSGNYVKSFINAVGCDSVHTLNLTINYSTTNSNAAITSCDSYTWNGYTYTTSGTYTYTSLNNAGCVNTATLNLAVNYSTYSLTNTTTCNSYTWSTNNQTYTQSGTYTHTSLNAAGCTHIDTLQLSVQVCQTELHLGCFIEGYYDGINGMVPVLYNQAESTSAGACDTLTVELHSATAPYNMEATATGILQQDGTALFSFPPQSGSKYIVVKHRSALETWSAQPVNMGAVVNYDFRTAAAQAYGSNQKDISGNGTRYALFSGDIIKDGNIDLYDLMEVSDDIVNFVYGYYPTDITGDGNVDLYDLLVPENNVVDFVFVLEPNSASNISSCNPANVFNPSLTYNNVSDQDGNVYKTIQIGNQEWMAENLRAGHYRNGDAIPVEPNNTTWGNLTTGASCWYNNDSASYNCPYGRLYNWFAVADSRNVCPLGWHVPSDAEWNKLLYFLVSSIDTNIIGWVGTNMGGSLKSTSSTWLLPNVGANNSSGFSLIPGGIKVFNGVPFAFIGEYVHLWSANEINSLEARITALANFNSDIYRGGLHKGMGSSVRCIKNDCNTTSTNSATACESYFWNLNNQTYTQSGTYTAACLNATGCTQTNILNLTINTTTTSSSSVTAVGSYTWAVNGQTYTQSGTYTATSLNAASCTQSNTLNLTINPISVPILTTTAISAITYTTASSGGSISDDGGVAITARGVCWSTSSNPTIVLSTKTIDGSGIGSFTSSITGLLAGTTYYVRAYASNSVGTAYGNEVVFTTSSVLAIGQSYQGGIIAYILQAGDPGYDANVPHGLIAAPSDQNTGCTWYNGSYLLTAATDTSLGAGNANTNTIVSVQGNMIYAAEICYDLVLNGYSDWYLPSLDELNKLYLNRSAIGGFVSSRYWSSSQYTWMTVWAKNFGSGFNDWDYTDAWGRIRAVRAITSDTSTFKVATNSVTAISQTYATCGGSVITPLGTQVISRGVCWSTSFNPTVNLITKTTEGGGIGTFTSSIIGLNPGTTYHVRAYATSNTGIVYGDDITFNTYSNALSIGQSYQGGIIAYILQPGDPGYDANVPHGLIVATIDTFAEWGCYQTTISGADGTAIGTGNQNTIDIMNGCSQAGIAARICGDLVLNGYSDWYLPSKNEIIKLYINRFAIGGFGTATLWSSSENDSANAWCQAFDSNGIQFITSKYNTNYVRAVRAF